MFEQFTVGNQKNIKENKILLLQKVYLRHPF